MTARTSRNPFRNLFDDKKLWPWAPVFAVFLIYAPFLSFRILRMAGDEKVYISQALEMARDHRWFVQTLLDVPDYYKGPLHYILLRFGITIFGHSGWALLYMNLLFLIGGALSLGSIVRRRLPQWKGGDVWIAVAFVTGESIFAHSFASQMEVELAGSFAIALALLDRLEKKEAGYLFWVVVGAIGWLKSPLHSALAGMGAVMFFALNGELLSRLKSLTNWLAVFLGVGVCAIGYAPAAILDWHGFYTAYYLRETVAKGGSGVPWFLVIVSVLGYLLFPWLFLALTTYLNGLRRLKQVSKDRGNRRLFFLSIGWATPTILFFALHTYRFENYTLPVVGAVLLLIANLWSQAKPGELKAQGYALGLTVLPILAVAIGLSVVRSRFHPPSFWWPFWLEPLFWICALSTAAGLLYYGLKESCARPQRIALSMIPVFFGMAALATVLGEREMIDVRSYLSRLDPQVRVACLNPWRSIWNEWGLLGFFVDHKIEGINTRDQLRDAVIRKDVILLRTREMPLEEFRKLCEKRFPGIKLQLTPWTRWRTQGLDSDGTPLWPKAWATRDLSILETPDYMIRAAWSSPANPTQDFLNDPRGQDRPGDP